MKTFLLFVFGIVLGLLSGCSTQLVLRNLALTESVVTLRQEYDAASLAVLDSIDAFSPQDQQRLRKLKASADRLVYEVMAAWESPETLTPERVNYLRSRGRELFNEARTVIGPRINYLSVDAVMRLNELKASLYKIDAALDQIEEGSNELEYTGLLMRLATTALRLATVR